MTASPLRSAPYRWLLGARTVSMLGNAIAPVALAFAVLDLTGSASDLGIVVAARSIANVLLLLFGGVVADRLPRSLVLVGSSLAAALTQGVVAALVLTDRATIPLLVLLGIANGAVAAISMPASLALTPQTVAPEQLRSANALLRVGTNGVSVAGAVLGGALVAGIGPGWGIAVDAASFALAAVMFSRLPVPPRTPSSGSTVLADLREGWGEFVSRRWVWVVVAQFSVVNAAYTGGVVVLGPAVADRTIGRGAWGVVLAFGAAGLLAGGFVALRSRPRFPLRIGTIAVLGMALPLLALAQELPTVLLAAAFFLSGVCVEQFGVAWDVSLQQHVPAEKLSRVYSYDAVGSFVAIPVGEVLVGPAADGIGLRPTLVVCTTLLVAATLLALSSRAVRDLERLADPAPA